MKTNKIIKSNLIDLRIKNKIILHMKKNNYSTVVDYDQVK